MLKMLDQLHTLKHYRLGQMTQMVSISSCLIHLPWSWQLGWRGLRWKYLLLSPPLRQHLPKYVAVLHWGRWGMGTRVAGCIGGKGHVGTVAGTCSPATMALGRWWWRGRSSWEAGWGRREEGNLRYIWGYGRLNNAGTWPGTYYNLWGALMRTKGALSKGWESRGLQNHLMPVEIHPTSLSRTETRGGFKPSSIQATEWARDNVGQWIRVGQNRHTHTMACVF